MAGHAASRSDGLHGSDHWRASGFGPSRLVASLLYGVNANDPMAIGIAMGQTLLIAVAAAGGISPLEERLGSNPWPPSDMNNRACSNY